MAGLQDGSRARERIMSFLDAGSFQELATEGAGAGSALIAGIGLANGEMVCVFSQEPAIHGGSLGVGEGAQIKALQSIALTRAIPLVGIWDGGGARIQEGIGALAAFGELFQGIIKLRQQVPQLSIIVGPCAGGSCYSPALTDYIIMVNNTSQMFLTGPQITRELTGENVSAEELGGCALHNSVSGVAHYAANTEQEAFSYARKLLTYLRDVAQNPAPPELAKLEIPKSPAQPYDMRIILAAIFDANSILEVQPAFAPNLITAYARLAGQPLAIVASQPMYLAGALDARAATKGSRFINTNSNLGLPIITFVDVPGFLPGIEQEQSGIIRIGADLVTAYVNANVPRITVITRKAFGGAYIALGSKALDNRQIVCAWPNAEIGIMGAEAAINLISRRELQRITTALGTNAAEARRAELIANYQQTQSAEAARMVGQIDAIIDPPNTRAFLCDALLGTANDAHSVRDTSGQSHGFPACIRQENE